MFIDAHTLIDERTLSPVYLFFVLIFLLMVARILNNFPDFKKLKIASYTVLILMVFFQAANSKETIKEYTENGIGYANSTWTSSNTLHFASKLPATTNIYSNGADVIDFLLNKKAFPLPKALDPTTKLDNKDFSNRR